MNIRLYVKTYNPINIFLNFVSPSVDEILNADWNISLKEFFGTTSIHYYTTINDIDYNFSFEESEWLVALSHVDVELSDEEFNFLKFKLLTL